ncbi:MAG: menaquinol-cytochrome c reductase cytochrome b subunit, partial [Actinomycetes bacterium]
MTEIPEHLLKRAQAAREKAAAEAGASTEGTASGDSRIPAHLLERSKAAKAGGSVAVAEKPSGAVVAAPAEGNVPMAAGPGGHTQRLLTVVKSGSIQDVKSEPVDKVHTWPHLLAVEFVAALACTAFLYLFSWVVNAPLMQAANFNQTPNPSKAPWYFLG